MTLPLWQASMMQCSRQPGGSGFTNIAFSSLSMICPFCNSDACQRSLQLSREEHAFLQHAGHVHSRHDRLSSVLVA